MKKNCFKYLLFGFIAILVLQQKMYAQYKWFKTGSATNAYVLSNDSSITHNGNYSTTLKSTGDVNNNFGTIMQYMKPGEYLGKRIKMTGYIKSKDVVDWSGFWLRVDQGGSDQFLSFDNMHNRPVKGTTDWTMCEIVLNVPDNASNIAFGALLSSTGQIWIDDVKFEVVDNSVPVTGQEK